ncbi:MAG TPA: MauE/DoxX family redox-associated membrane protein [Bryobacteraceae bacterium]
MVVVVWIVRLILALVFAIAGIAKFADLAGARKSLADFGAPAFLVHPVALVLPGLELACAFGLLWGGSVFWGAAGAIVLLVLFTAAAGIAIARGKRPNCHCFGQLYSTPVGPKTLIRNAVLGAMAALVLWQAPNATPDALRQGLRPFETGWPAAAVVLGLLLVLHFWTVLVLLQQNGRLLLRVEALEARVSPPEPEQPGLPMDVDAPNFTLSGLDGETVVSTALFQTEESQTENPALLVFAEPGCGACETLFPEIAQWQVEHGDRISITVISSGPREANLNRRDKHHLQNVLLQKDHEVAKAFKSEATPAAVLIRNGRIASPLAEGVDAVRGLVVGSTLPPPLQKGDRVPELGLPDLNGEVFDLSTLRGRHTLLLFWDPGCGFCQGMVTDLRTQELARPTNAPDLLIITKGTADATRAHGFRSRVLVDRYSAAGTLFGANGTPGAVLLDEEGRVASELGAGACATFEMLGFLPYIPTPHATVDAMLKMAMVQSNDTLYDLGCGDGRVVIAAARKYGARGFGVDINPERIAEARANARKASVEEMVRFEQREISHTDIRGASVVTFYALPKINLQLRSKLFEELKPGTRVVSHAFDMQDWKPDREEVIGGNHIFLWTIPGE